MRYSELQILERRRLTPDYFDQDILHVIPTIPNPTQTVPRTLLRLAVWTHPHERLATFARGTHTDHPTYPRWFQMDQSYARDTHTLDLAGINCIPARYRAEIAASPDLDPSLITQLANDPAYEVRASIATRPDLPEKLMRALAQAPEPRVRMLLAQHQKLPTDLINQLAHDQHKGVRLTLTNHQLSTAT